eukprot:GILJ01013384.1.p1 GENE.GILJ01013384.1~~GILJ01013384.1.p1  ORF type:complete len:1149 (+),score=101.59 GILJ01013384.1:72-3518(+)
MAADVRLSSEFLPANVLQFIELFKMHGDPNALIQETLTEDEQTLLRLLGSGIERTKLEQTLQLAKKVLFETVERNHHGFLFQLLQNTVVRRILNEQNDRQQTVLHHCLRLARAERRVAQRTAFVDAVEFLSQVPIAEVVSFHLIKAGADMQILDDEDVTPYDLLSGLPELKRAVKAYQMNAKVSLVARPPHGKELESTGAGGSCFQEGAVYDGTYLMKKQLHVGKMCETWQAYHQTFLRHIIVKALRPAHMINSVRDKFRDQAALWMKLDASENIVSAYFPVTIHEVPCLLIEEVDDGLTLLSCISNRLLYKGKPTESLNRIISYAMNIAVGLEYLHKQQFVHQEVRPAKVLVSQDTCKLNGFAFTLGSALPTLSASVAQPGDACGTDRVKLLRDILSISDQDVYSAGLACNSACAVKFVNQLISQLIVCRIEAKQQLQTVLTQCASRMASSTERRSVYFHSGCLQYWSPEQEIAPVDDSAKAIFNQRTDIYSFGVLFLHMLIGRVGVPWKNGAAGGEELLQYLDIEHMGPDTRILQPAYAMLKPMLKKCLEVDCRRRYQDMTELRHDLLKFRQSLWARQSFEWQRVAIPTFTSSRTLNNMALYMYNRGQAHIAVELLKLAIQTDPTYIPSSYNLHLLHWQEGAETDRTKWKPQGIEVKTALQLLLDAGQDNQVGSVSACRDALQTVMSMGVRTEYERQLFAREASRLRAREQEANESWCVACPEPIASVCWSKDAKRVLAVSTFGKVFAWTAFQDGLKCECLKELTEGQGMECIAAISDNATKMAAIRSKEVLLVEDSNLCRVTRDDDTNSFQFTAVALSSNGLWMLLGTKNGAVLMFETRTDTLFTSYSSAQHGGVVTSVALNADGEWGMSVGRDGQIIFWNLFQADDQIGLPFRSAREDWMLYTACTLSSDGRIGVSGDTKGNISIWRVLQGIKIKTLDAIHGGSVLRLCLTEDSCFLASGADDDTACIIELHHFRVSRRFDQALRGRVAIVRTGSTLKCVLAETRAAIPPTMNSSSSREKWVLKCCNIQLPFLIVEPNFLAVPFEQIIWPPLLTLEEIHAGSSTPSPQRRDSPARFLTPTEVRASAAAASSGLGVALLSPESVVKPEAQAPENGSATSNATSAIMLDSLNSGLNSHRHAKCSLM